MLAWIEDDDIIVGPETMSLSEMTRIVRNEGIKEATDVMNEVFDAFEVENPEEIISYVLQYALDPEQMELELEWARDIVENPLDSPS